MNEALRKAVEDGDAAAALATNDSKGVGQWATIKQALRDQESEITRLSAANIAYASDNANLQGRAMSAESEIAAHRANHDALVIRLGEVTTRLEAADGLLRDIVSFPWFVRRAPFTTEQITTHLKAADHV